VQEVKDKNLIDKVINIKNFIFKMIIPIRCMSCGKPVGHLWQKFNELKKSKSVKEAMDEAGLERYCCRSLFLSHVDLIDIVSKFKRF